MKRTILLFIGVLCAALTTMANPGEKNITVIISQIEDPSGTLTVTLFDKSENWLQRGVRQQVTVTGHEMIIVFEGIEPGNYAVSVTHDANSNGKLDTGAFGIPVEDYGFSNNARGMFGPASFEDSMFTVTEDQTIQINIH